MLPQGLPVDFSPIREKRSPQIAVEAHRTIFGRVDPRHSTDQGLLNACGGVTAALKRPVELQPAAEGRSVQVVIGVTILDRRKGFSRLVSAVRKGGLVADPGV